MMTRNLLLSAIVFATTPCLLASVGALAQNLQYPPGFPRDVGKPATPPLGQP
jgi:hypothetical protein